MKNKTTWFVAVLATGAVPALVGQDKAFDPKKVWDKPFLYDQLNPTFYPNRLEHELQSTWGRIEKTKIQFDVMGTTCTDTNLTRMVDPPAPTNAFFMPPLQLKPSDKDASNEFETVRGEQAWRVKQTKPQPAVVPDSPARPDRSRGEDGK